MKYLDFIKQEMAVIMDRDPAIKSKNGSVPLSKLLGIIKVQKSP